VQFPDTCRSPFLSCICTLVQIRNLNLNSVFLLIASCFAAINRNSPAIDKQKKTVGRKFLFCLLSHSSVRSIFIVRPINARKHILPDSSPDRFSKAGHNKILPVLCFLTPDKLFRDNTSAGHNPHHNDVLL